MNKLNVSLLVTTVVMCYHIFTLKCTPTMLQIAVSKKICVQTLHFEKLYNFYINSNIGSVFFYSQYFTTPCKAVTCTKMGI